MGDWLAPAKLNLSLLVGRRDDSGRHPIRSLVQTIDWCDTVGLVEAEEDRLDVTIEGSGDAAGEEVPDGPDNLVWKAVEAMAASGHRPSLHLTLVKRIPAAAGLGGGSSDAAAALAALADLLRRPPAAMRDAAARVGADVPFLLVGGSAWLGGHGEQVQPADRLAGVSIGVVVPAVRLSTAEVYRRWDDLDGPTGTELPGPGLPPPLRRAGLRNDLTPAAVDLAPELADVMAEAGREWGTSVGMSGSGPALFAFFPGLDEAVEAVEALPGMRARWAGDLRARGVERVEDDG